jgi:hypothetical protein
MSERKEKTANALLDILRGEYDNEDDQLEVINLLMSKVSVKTDVSKLHSSGFAEMKSCMAIGLTWNRGDMQGMDAKNTAGNGVEIKTYRRTHNRNTFSINYLFPARKPQETDEAFRIRVVNYFMESEKFAGGHYWVAFNQAKTEIYRWNFVKTKTVADSVDEYLRRNPKSKSVNFGGAICEICKRSHRVDNMSKLFMPKGAEHITCARTVKAV